MAKLSERYGMQVLCSSMVLCEDVDVGILTLDDLHKKTPYVQMRVEIIQSLQHVRSTQLRLFNCGLGTEDAIDDIAPNLHCTRLLMGEEVVLPIEKSSRTTLGFVAEVHEAMNLESLDLLYGVHRISM